MPSSIQSRDSKASKTNRRDALANKLALAVLKRVRESGINVASDTFEDVRMDIAAMLDRGPVTENDLTKLATRIKHQHSINTSTNRQERTMDNYTEVSRHETRAAATAPANVSRNDTAAAMAIPSSDLHTMAQHVRSLPPLLQKRIMIQRQQGPWSRVLQQEAEQHAREIVTQREKAIVQREEQRAFLDMQVKRREEEKRREKDRMKVQALEEDAQRVVWQQEEDAEVRRRRKETTALAQDLRAQREIAVKRKKEEVLKLKVEEQQKVQQLQKELQVEENEKKVRKDQVKVEIREYLSANEELLKKKEMEKSQVAQADVLALKAYEEKLEKQDKERDANFRKVYDRQAHQYSVANQLYQTWQEQLKKDEEKAEGYQRKLDDARQDRESKRKHDSYEAAKKLKELVAQQIVEKERQKEHAKQEAVKLREEVARNVARAEEVDAKRKHEARLFAMQGLRDIDKQLVELHARRLQPQPIKVGERMDKPKFLEPPIAA